MSCKKIISVMALSVMIVSLSIISANACTSVVVGKKASVDGSVMTTHTCDGQYDARIRIIPGKEFEPGAMAPVYRDLCHDGIPGKPMKQIGEIPQVNKTYTYYNVGYPFMNENQVPPNQSHNLHSTICQFV